MSDSDLLVRLRQLPGPRAGPPPIAAIAKAGRRKARGRGVVIGTVAFFVAVPMVMSLWGLAGIGRGQSGGTRADGHTLTEPLWSGQSKALMESVKAWGPGATFEDAPCSPHGTSLTLGTPHSDLLGYSPSCLAVAANTSFTISFTNSIRATNGDASSMGFSLYNSPDDAFILGDQVSPWTITSATEANALFRGDNVATGKTIQYDVSGLQPGVYYFQDDFHPMAMNGVLVVESI
jgi:hypothetical protein